MRDTIPQSTNILIPSKGYLKIGSGKIFNMTPTTGGSVNLIIQDSSVLSLETSSHLFVGYGNILTLKSKGLINFALPSAGINNAEIKIENGGLFCNEGGRIRNGSITYGKGYNHHLLCATVQDVFYSDSTKIILSDSAVMEIPDGITMNFTGIKSGLIMKPNSKLMFGVGSKIIFDSSASLIANGAIFTSMDSTLKWDGIILSNTDADTITNCTFSNAVTALTFTNNSNSAYKNRIITNNTFNIPSWGVNKGIYGENNYKILIKNNVFNMPVYYPSGSLTTLDIRIESKNEEKISIPLQYKLEQNYPNPFNPSTTIKYSIPKNGLVTLKIYDVLGKEILTLINETKETGSYEIEFNGSNFSSGAYFYRIESGKFINIKRMILIK